MRQTKKHLKNKTERERKRREENTLLHKGQRFKHKSIFFTNLSLMTNTATPSTSNKNTNNCDKLKYILRTNKKQNKQTKKYYCLKLRNIQTQQSKTDTNLNFQGRERESEREGDVLGFNVPSTIYGHLGVWGGHVYYTSRREQENFIKRGRERGRETERERERQTDRQRISFYLRW